MTKVKWENETIDAGAFYICSEVVEDKIEVGVDYYGDEGVEVTSYEMINDEDLYQKFVDYILYEGFGSEPDFKMIDAAMADGRIKEQY